jgi:glycosyltransferase 2 family protein
MALGRGRLRLDARAIARLFVGTTLGGVALWLAFRRTDLGAVGHSLERMHVWPAFAALLLLVATVMVGARRWELLVYPRSPSRVSPQFVAATLVGQMLNVLLPMRLGEVVRAYWISRRERQPLGRILATIAVERLADVLVLGVSVVVLLLQMRLPPWARSSGRVAVGVCVVAVVSAVALARFGGPVMRLIHATFHLLPNRIRLSVIRNSEIALAELRAREDWRSSLKVGGLSMLAVALAAGTNYALFPAFDLSLSPMTAWLLFVVLQIGGAPAATPGNVGVFHYLTVLVLTAYGVDRSAALAYAIVLHAIAVGPKIIAGAIIMGTTRTPLPELAWTTRALEPAPLSATES